MGLVRTPEEVAFWGAGASLAWGCSVRSTVGSKTVECSRLDRYLVRSGRSLFGRDPIANAHDYACRIVLATTFIGSLDECVAGRLQRRQLGQDRTNFVVFHVTQHAIGGQQQHIVGLR